MGLCFTTKHTAFQFFTSGCYIYPWFVPARVLGEMIHDQGRSMGENATQPKGVHLARSATLPRSSGGRREVKAHQCLGGVQWMHDF